ncbi:DoxX family protein [Sphingomicrobium sediminis]|uniref:DoxX family protein n=1 Tax=Sphingomicrobium sediminis TaxID=2950949 RepID=A0A9X2EKE1_9SPHN|nr:DoxX family protein [Sphingomicrobium sediminis]MCM8557224.1 DoxX family protein [Sphingomicrobium sediminis]
MKIFNDLKKVAKRPLVQDIVLLLTRLGLGGIFWVSGRTKVEEGSLLDIKPTTYGLFENLYGGVPLLPSDVSAVLATYAEHALPLLLAVGLLSRFAAAGLFVMTLVIQLFVFPGAFLSPHLGWFALALVVMTQGPGRFSLDYLLGKKA